MRVALIRPLYRTARYDPEIQEALGLETLAAFLRSHGHQVLLLDVMLSGQSEETTARRAMAFGPDAVGFSAMSHGDLESIRFIAGRLADVPAGARLNLAVGGSLISTEAPAACAMLPQGTVCVSYEGERTFLALLNAWNAGRPPDGVPSLTYRGRDGGLVQSPAGAAIEELDALPPPARDLLDYVVARGQAVNIQGSRGCPGACAYCCTPAFPHPALRRWRGRSAENIAGEIADIAAQGSARTFNFVDDDFLGPNQDAQERAEAFASAIAARRLRVGFSVQARPGALTEAAIGPLDRAGLAYVFLGVETDDARILGSWRRPRQAQLAWKAVDRLRRRGIEVQAGCIMFHPQATMESVRRLAVRLRDQKLLNYRTASNRLQLLPKSQLYEDARRSATIPDGSIGPVTPGMGAPGMEQLHRLLLEALEPLRPAWVHGACALPNAVCAVKAGAQDDAGNGRRTARLRAILSDLDTAVATTLFGLLDAIENGRNESDEMQRLRRMNLQAGQSAARNLSRHGLVESYDVLREAVSKDSGL